MKHLESARRKSRSSAFSTETAKPGRRAVEFVVCVSNEGFAASLESRKIYRAVADDAATSRGLIRVVDESGEDYLYPAGFFRAIELPPALQQVLRLAS